MLAATKSGVNASTLSQKQQKRCLNKVRRSLLLQTSTYFCILFGLELQFIRLSIETGASKWGNTLQNCSRYTLCNSITP